MPSNLPRFTLRAEQELLDKYNEIARASERSMNQQVVFVLKEYLKEYEKENGAIKINIANTGTNNGIIVQK